MMDISLFDELSDDVSNPIQENSVFSDDDPSSDALTSYMAQIGKYRVPTAKEERELLILANQGDARARHDLVTRNLRLVVMFVTRIMRRWKPHSVSREDLIQAGNIGLMEAIDRFDIGNFDVRLSTYAAWHINNRIWRVLKYEDRTVRLPMYLEDRIGDYVTAVSALRSELGRDPTVSEVSAKLGISPDDTRRLEQLSSGSLSLDAPIDGSEGDLSMIDTLPFDDISLDERVLWSEAILALEKASGCLSDDDRMMFFDFVGIFAERKIQSELGAERGMSPKDAGMRVGGIRQKLRIRMKRQGLRAEHFL
ncbi:MAG: sigma-70 family RNA polymerase sigma factor [Candidatus Moranbacteria bacterium]|nr:sigma-70 family RNA polymerase sigma factor [Candidatus Moranbacteria bacterium]